MDLSISEGVGFTGKRPFPTPLRGSLGLRGPSVCDGPILAENSALDFFPGDRILPLNGTAQGRAATTIPVPSDILPDKQNFPLTPRKPLTHRGFSCYNLSVACEAQPPLPGCGAVW